MRISFKDASPLTFPHVVTTPCHSLTAIVFDPDHAIVLQSTFPQHPTGSRIDAAFRAARMEKVAVTIEL